MSPEQKTSNSHEPTYLEDEGLKVIKSIEFTTLRQEIRIPSYESFVPIVSQIAQMIRLRKFTGRMIIHWNMGGVMKITSEEEYE